MKTSTEQLADEFESLVSFMAEKLGRTEAEKFMAKKLAELRNTLKTGCARIEKEFWESHPSISRHGN